MTNFLYTRNTNSGISKNTFECIKIKTNCNKDMLLFKKFCDTRTYKGTDISYSYMWCMRPNRNSISHIEKVGHTWLIQERIGENISATGLHSSKDYKENTDNFSNFASDVGSASANTEIIQLVDVESTPVVEKSTSIRESIILKSINLTQVVFPLSP